MSQQLPNNLIVNLDDEAASQQLAKRLAALIKAPLTITFSGEIGTGKTTIVRAMLQQLGIDSAIKSPTFSLVESYSWRGGAIHHFDLYRLQQEEELEYLGFRDYFTPESICCIEWPEHGGRALPASDILFKLDIKGTGRELHCHAGSVAGEHIIAGLVGES